MKPDRERYFIACKPYGMVSQFSKSGPGRTLAGLFAFPKDVYPVGRLDADSEGLLVLTNDTRLNRLLLDPGHAHARTYWVQVEGLVQEADARRLEQGLVITVNKKPYRTLPCKAKPISPPPGLPERIPPVRYRKSVPDSWLEITLYEGKNRQVRKMTAAAGFPTLRLIRKSIESLSVSGMKPGTVLELSRRKIYRLLRLAGGE